MLKKKILIFSFFLITTTAQAADMTVSEEHLDFIPGNIAVSKGDAIIFANNDDVVHNLQVTDSEGTSEDKGLQKPGEDTKVAFDESGEYYVRCAIHPKMKITVTVK